MGPEWFEQDPGRWSGEQIIAHRLMTHVRCSVAERLARIEGTLSVTSEHGHEYGPFDISVQYPRGFTRPGYCPDIYLRSHRDRWETGWDSHIERDWRLCLFVTIESGIDFSRPDSLEELIAVARLFLAKEYFYQKQLLAHLRLRGPRPVWPGEDRSHGVSGIQEAIDAVGEPRGNAPCPCGSGWQFKRCHAPLLPEVGE